MSASPAPSASTSSPASASSASATSTIVSSPRSLSITGPSGSFIATSDAANPSGSVGSSTPLASTSASVSHEGGTTWTGASSAASQSASLSSSTFEDYSSSYPVTSAYQSSSRASSSSHSAAVLHTHSTTSSPQWTQSVNSFAVSSNTAVSSSGPSTSSEIVPLVASTSTSATPYLSTSGSTFSTSQLASASPDPSALHAAEVSSEAKHERNTLLVAILVPVLVVLLVIVPSIIFIVRLRRRRQARFMPHYDLAPNPTEPSFSIRKPYADSIATSGSHYSMASAPNSAMVHSEFLQQDLEVQMPSLPPRLPFPDFADRDDVRAPLFVETDVPHPLASREGSITGSPTGSTHSRWAFSPTASIAESLHRVRSKLSTRSGASAHPPAPPPVLDPLAPRLFADPAHIQPAAGDVDWSMDDDPFANLSAPEEGREPGAAPGPRGAPGHAYTSLLRKLTHRS